MVDEDLQKYIYEHIPIVKSNGFEIGRDESGLVTVRGAFKEHINHRNSVFGGSLGTALVLSAWANVRDLLVARGIPNGVVVIQSESVRFLKPVTGDFVARTVPVPVARLGQFISMLNKFGKGRITMEATIRGDASDEVLSEFTGAFVVVLNRDGA